MTVAKCTAACASANFILAGIEYSGECYCGNSFANGGAPAVDGCNMICNGNSSEYCGGPNRLNVYDFQHKFLPLPTSTSTPVPTASSAASSAGVSSSSQVGSSTVVTSSSAAVSSSSIVVVVASSSAVSSSSAAPTPTVLSQPATVGAWKWYGCQTEATNTRALNAKTFASDDMTLEKCATFCAGNTFFGVEYSRECWCGNSFAAGSVAVPASQCSMKCMGNQLQYCGEGNRLSVYTIGDATQPSSTSSSATGSVTGAATSTSAAAVASNLPTGWTNQGCWVDNLNGRILPNQLPDDPAMTLSSCAQACSAAGYTVAGAEYHTQCFCGNAIYYGGAVASDPQPATLRVEASLPRCAVVPTA
ncbi:WSC domain-containing protein [Colletotrichum tofieldiae]|nr:WSC domain-containing protein [Colletotrichum tofieldiae]